MTIVAALGIWIHLAISMLGILLYVLTTHALQQHRHPAAAVAWMLAFFFVPYLALPAFLFFGQRKLRPRAEDARRRIALQHAMGDPRRHWLSKMLRSLGATPGRPEGELHLHLDATTAEAALWRSIASARERIFVCTYVLGDDRIGSELIRLLADRARAGLEVRLLLDGVGCLRVRQRQVEPLIEAGGHVARAFPPLRRLLRRQSNFRNHRKLLVVDAHTLWTGGRNFADEYFSGHAGQLPWFDLSLDVTGPLAVDAESVFRSDWRLATGERLTPSPPLPAQTALPAVAATPGLTVGAARAADPVSAAAASPDAVMAAIGAPAAPAAPALTQAGDDWADEVAADGGPRALEPDNEVQLLPSGPDQPIDSLESLLVTACFRATRRILIVTPYLIPNAALVQALCLAARRQVGVDVVLPIRSNHPLADFARGRAIREMAMAGVNVWLAPRMNHAKACVFDDLALCGSANLDSRSLFLNFELTTVLYRPAQAEAIAGWIGARRAESVAYEPQPLSLTRDLLEGAVLWIGFQL